MQRIETDCDCQKIRIRHGVFFGLHGVKAGSGKAWEYDDTPGSYASAAGFGE